MSDEQQVITQEIALSGPQDAPASFDGTTASVSRPERIAALKRTDLLDSPLEEPYDRIARLAARVMETPIATVTLLDVDRQFYKACVGLPEPLNSTRQTSLEFSFCKHTVSLGTPLVIGDTRADERVARIPPVTEYGVLAYAGVPLLVDGEAIGTLCVMDMKPRSWSTEAVGMLNDLAASVMTEIQLRIAVGNLEESNREAVTARAEAEWANRRKSEFLAMMSHDLRTPLNAIGGYRQLLELGVHGPVNDGQRQTLARIKRASDHLLHMVSEILGFARLESGGQTLSISDVVVHEALVELESLVRPQLDAKNLSYTYDSADVVSEMRVDGDHLRRVVVNLLTNAIKFTPSGGKVTLSWAPDGEHVLIRVIDSGIGVPEDLADRIFEPFVQVPGQRQINPDGVGLGLAIGRRLARAMQGELTVSSSKGNGATFELRVPRAQTERINVTS